MKVPFRKEKGDIKNLTAASTLVLLLPRITTLLTAMAGSLILLLLTLAEGTDLLNGILIQEIHYIDPLVLRR